ncbi:hypothetical protein CHLNCDRAFT_33822 [Chlorella variabilis]|uniref:Complex III subunit VII n=1 Tax=Chlorella variabilis TaxID=554065 RepID=E1Z4I4_CHLVA|nr:hypothetical protein CHLNCDRAFT_33822 [Chlorella variabilis]EFN59065.1 hypothetical protein CHLNCDRAFT_33822 [Chlorella variabilis]|eukprot:XP_005851167.1 hypothetical protein CHLNCDRAFT_33822 [Chlorella variabilis]
MAARAGMLAKLFDPLVAMMAPRYQAAVGKELIKYGLRYEDLYDPQLDLDVDEALKRLPQDVLDARNQRLKRAHDLNMKHSELPKDLQQLQTPYSFYLKDALELVRLESDERLALGAGKPYERHFP